MTINECQENIGRRVIFRYIHGGEEAGIITAASNSFAFVRFDSRGFSDVCSPDYLRLEES